MKIIQDYSNYILSLNSKIHLVGAVLNINQLGFVNLTCRWSHRSNVWIPNFYFTLLFFFQNPLPPKSNHSWNLWYPFKNGVVNKKYRVAKNPKGQHTWPISNLQSTTTKNKRKIVRKKTITTRYITNFAKPIVVFAYNLRQVLPCNICIEFNFEISYKTCPITIWASSFPPIHPTPPHSK